MAAHVAPPPETASVYETAEPRRHLTLRVRAVSRATLATKSSLSDLYSTSSSRDFCELSDGRDTRTHEHRKARVGERGRGRVVGRPEVAKWRARLGGARRCAAGCEARPRRSQALRRISILSAAAVRAASCRVKGVGKWRAVLEGKR
eukprot:6173413-Pleurochrysis_carterae.AAC.2